MAEAKEFSTILKAEEVILVGEDAVKKSYFIKELTGKQRQEYQDQFDVKLGLDADNKPTMSTGDDFKLWTDTDYLSRCLYEKDKNEPIGSKFVEGLPGNMVKELTEDARKLSGLDAESMKKAKNDLEASDSNGIV